MQYEERKKTLLSSLQWCLKATFSICLGGGRAGGRVEIERVGAEQLHIYYYVEHIFV